MRQKITTQKGQLDFTPKLSKRKNSHSPRIVSSNPLKKEIKVSNFMDQQSRTKEMDGEEFKEKLRNLSKSPVRSIMNVSEFGFQKHQSESEILMRDQQRKNQQLLSGSAANKIQLIVRIRPFLQTEQMKECLKVVHDQGIKLFKEYHQIHFKFDTILMPKDSQDHVFSQIQNITQSFLLGMNGTIFAYGQTGAGKTYSIIGGEQRGQELINSTKKGILPRTLDYLFLKINNNPGGIKLSVSFFEIYNDKIYDLLRGGAPTQNEKQKGKGGSFKGKEYLELREEKDGNFQVADLKRIYVNSLEEAYSCLDQGLLKRVTSSTSLNNKSSRSHSIFQIYLEKQSEEGITIKSKLRIVDLAGSEKYSIKKDLPPAEKNLKIQELTSINSSLSALGQCISALAEHSRKHIPYRNSKLTKVLKDSLDENSHVALIICVSPSIDSYKESFSTLQFADRAKKAILDGRNFSDSKLIEDQANQGALNGIFKAYQEEKAIRKELEQYVKDNYQAEVLQELERLKEQNKILQEQVKELQKSSSKQLVSCLKKPGTQNLAKQISQNSIQQEGEGDKVKRVRFAQKLDNDSSIDSDLRERIEHNLKYNDDTIFDNISIFRDVNNSGLYHPKIVDKEVHPSKMKQKFEIEDDEDEDEDEQQEEEKEKPVKPQTPPQEPQVEEKKIEFNSEKFFDGQEEEQKLAVSPISKNIFNTNNSYQDVSKDLIELENENQLDLFKRDQFPQPGNVGDKTMGTSKKKVQPKQCNKSNHDELQQSHQSIKNEEKQDQTETEDDAMAKDYHVCESSEQFFEPDFSINQQNQGEPILSDSLRIEEANEKEEGGNSSQDNQNTLILDSQSIILEAGDINNQFRQDPNLSQQMQMLEASSIIQQRELPVYGSNQVNLGFQSSSNANSSNLNTDILTYSLTNTFSTIESLHDELSAIRTGLETSQKRGINILRTIQRYAREIEENKLEDNEEEENVKSAEESAANDRDQSHEEDNINFIKDLKIYYNRIHNEIHQLKGILLEQNNQNNNQTPSKSSKSSPPSSNKKHILSERVPQKPQQVVAKKVEPKSKQESINREAIDKSQKIVEEIKKEMQEIFYGGAAMREKRRDLRMGAARYKSSSFANQRLLQNYQNKPMRVLELLETLQMALLQTVQNQKLGLTPINESPVSKKSKNGKNVNNQGGSPDQSLINMQVQQQQTYQRMPHFSNEKNHIHLEKLKKPTQIQDSIQIPEEESKRSFLIMNSINYEEDMPSIHNSPDVINQMHIGLQRTPELFKSLAKLENSDDPHQQQYQTTSHTKRPPQMQRVSQQNFFSIPAKNMNSSSMNNDFNSMVMGRDNSKEYLQTLKSNSQVFSQNEELKFMKQGQIKEKDSKKKVDNTLTLIFDSEEEDGGDQPSGDDIIANDFKQMKNKQDIDDEYFLNDDSIKLERGSSANPYNSFNADSSLMFLASNLAPNQPTLQQRGSIQHLQEQLFKKRSKSINSRNEREEGSEKIKTVERQEFFNQLSQQNPNFYQQMNQQQQQQMIMKGDLPRPMSFQVRVPNSRKQSQREKEVESSLNFTDSAITPINDESCLTSKQSVLKYWNQFFNKEGKEGSQQKLNIQQSNNLKPMMFGRKDDSLEKKKK